MSIQSVNSNHLLVDDFRSKQIGGDMAMSIGAGSVAIRNQIDDMEYSV